MYRRVDCSKYNKVFIVSDLHGCYNSFIKALEKEDFDPNTDLVVSVGDLIARGENNIECLGLLYEDWFLAVRGNHDQMALDAIEKHNITNYQNWVYNGGSWFYQLTYNQSFAEHLIKNIKSLPYVIELDLPQNSVHKKIIVSHTDYPSDTYEYGKKIDSFEVIWSRDRINAKDDLVVKGADLFVHGHTPLKEAIKLGNRLYIDTGCVFGGKLTLLQVNEDGEE